MKNSARSSRGDLAIGAGVVTLALVLAWQASVIPDNSAYAQVGPALFPWAIAAVLLVLGVLLTLAALRGGWTHTVEDAPEYTRWTSLGWVALGLFINVATIEFVGFILASTAMFVLIARGFESRALARDAVIGFSLALAAYIGFDRLLGYKIGSGLIESLI